MTDRSHPSEVDGELPRLPAASRAVPPQVTWLPTGEPLSLPNPSAPGRRPTPPHRSRRRVAVIAVGALAAGITVLAAFVIRHEGRDEQDSPPSARPPMSSSPEQAPSVTDATDAMTEPATTPHATVPMSVSSPPPVASIRAVTIDTAVFELIERCRSEQRLIFASLQAYMNTTGAVPSHPDALVRIGWLESHPDGWSSRWAFVGRDGMIYVEPVDGGLCDL